MLAAWTAHRLAGRGCERLAETVEGAIAEAAPAASALLDDMTAAAHDVDGGYR